MVYESEVGSKFALVLSFVADSLYIPCEAEDTEINMGLNVTQKLIQSHLLSGAMTAGEEIGIHIDQTLTQDATGTLVMLELESMGLDSARTELSCQYVDHNLIQEDHNLTTLL
jgi:hypothetical protein